MPSPTVKAAQAEAFAASGLQKDTRLNLANLPGTSFNPIGFLEVPAFLVLAFALRADFERRMIGYMFVLYLWKECVPMSVCLHRYFSHKGFECGRGMQFLLYLGGCLASQGPPLWWASKHRRHHAHCDTPQDPHTPVCFSKWYAWVGWCYLASGEGPIGSGHDQEYVQGHLRFPELAFMENFYFVPIVAVHLGFYAALGPAWAVYVSVMSGCFCQLLTLYFNVLFHSHPDQAHLPPGACRAADIPTDPLSNLFGEAYHAWHHDHPLAYKRPGVDLPYWACLKPLLACGLIWGPNKLHGGGSSSGNLKKQAAAAGLAVVAGPVKEKNVANGQLRARNARTGDC